jgi:hypothetical protein
MIYVKAFLSPDFGGSERVIEPQMFIGVSSSFSTCKHTGTYHLLIVLYNNFNLISVP